MNIGGTWYFFNPNNCQWMESFNDTEHDDKHVKPIKKESGMSELICGREALIALANGDEVQWVSRDFEDWHPVDPNTSITKAFLNEDHIAKCELKFRLKPKTILLNGIEVPAPFEPKKG